MKVYTSQIHLNPQLTNSFPPPMTICRTVELVPSAEEIGARG